MINIGKYSSLHKTCVIENECNIEIGNRTIIGPNVRIFGSGNLKIGNHVKIHNNVTLCVKGEAFINDTSWIGQDSYIDATGELIINRFSVIGIGSTICTHVRGGDILSGCKYDSDGKCVIGEDVWLMTRTLIGPYSIGNKTISLMGSLITKDFESNKIIGGSPAIDLTDKLGKPFQEKNQEEKLNFFESKLEEYKVKNKIKRKLSYGFSLSNWDGHGTFYDLKTRKCHTTLKEEEDGLNNWLFGYKAKFSMEYEN